MLVGGHARRLEAERVIMPGIADEASTKECLSRAEDAVLDDEWETVTIDLEGLDLGVASAVIVLSAVGCYTAASCNSWEGHAESHPLIWFWCRRYQVADLLAAAEVAGCGLINHDEGDMLLYGRSVREMYRFARELFDRRDSLARY